MVNPVFVALDRPALKPALELAHQVAPHVGGFKVGLELIWAEGPGVVEEIAKIGLPVFLDAKLHDIPNTVFAATKRIRDLGARFVTVHALGGTEMIHAAVAGLAGGDTPQGVLAVTVLTSLDVEAMSEVGIEGVIEARAVSLATMAAASGAEGVVCSVAETRAIKSREADLLVATPGIREIGTSRDDQARSASPLEAIEAGADILVVGRAITGSDRPAEAAARILDGLPRG